MSNHTAHKRNGNTKLILGVIMNCPLSQYKSLRQIIPSIDFSTNCQNIYVNYLHEK